MSFLLPNWTGWKTIKAILTVIAIGASATERNMDIDASVRAIVHIIAQVDQSALLLVIFLSGTSGGPPIAASYKRAKMVPTGTTIVSGLILLCLAGYGISACSAAQNQKAIVPVTDLVVCVFRETVPLIEAGDAWTDIISRVAKACATDEASVSTIWASHIQAESREGKNPTIPKGYNLPVGH